MGRGRRGGGGRHREKVRRIQCLKRNLRRAKKRFDSLYMGFLMHILESPRIRQPNV